MQLVKRSNPDIAEKLPLHIDPPNVRANPCWLNATGALSCLPYVMLAGGLHCGVPDLYQRLAAHHDVSFLGDSKSSLGDAKSSLGDAESSLGDAES
jgi:hypothetical protein